MGSPLRALATPARLAAALGVALLVWAVPAVAAERPRPLPPVAPIADDALARALASGRLTEAEYALERGRSLFALPRVRARYGDVKRPSGREATLILRDLAARLHELSGSERRAAEAILARPTGGSVPIGNPYTVPSEFTCGADMCFHWVPTTADAPQPTDTTPANGIPDWVDTTQATFELVWAQEIDAIGYRGPLDDSSSGQGDGPAGADVAKLDIYLQDLGGPDIGVFGYCTSDDPNAGAFVFAVSAYCVVDNDYSPLQFGTSRTPEEFLQVTAAHEFNHASQFAYDWLEDYWLLEGTATNMEETVFPDVDDNVVFLAGFSPLTRPGSPVDRGGFGDSEYGSWIFWRYVQEHVFANDPGSIRSVWERADAATPTSPDYYSLEAVRRVLALAGVPFREAFVRFGIANRLRDYEDGALYPKPPLLGQARLGPRAPTTGRKSVRTYHLTTRYFGFTPGGRVRARARLNVALDLTGYGAEATLIVYPKTGAVRIWRVALDKHGNGRQSVRFGRAQVKRVELVLTNASWRTNCWEDLEEPPFYSCFGAPLEDRRVYRFRATLAG